MKFTANEQKTKYSYFTIIYVQNAHRGIYPKHNQHPEKKNRKELKYVHG